MKSHDAIRNRISVLLASGAWTERAMRQRLRKHVGRIAETSQRKLARSVIAEFEDGPQPPPSEIYRWLSGSAHFRLFAKAVARRNIRLPVVLSAPAFAPSPPFAGLEIPCIKTSGHLAEWLGISIGHLDWLADVRRQHALVNEKKLQHYSFTILKKSSGRPRLIESPKATIKRVQQKILREILDRVPVNDRAHGFVKGRSCRSSASIHAGEVCVLAMDIQNFFHAIVEGRVKMLFRCLGYPQQVADLLTRLCMTTTPVSAFNEISGAEPFDWTERKLLSQPHLPQGAPTSPALANFAAWRLDQRLAGLAARYGANYSRYADDLAFSGDAGFAERIRAFQNAVDAISRDEGFSIHSKKTRVMYGHMRQSLTGIVVNAHVNIARPEYDRLKAILHNCKSHGAAGQNREDHADFRRHLDGRVNWIENVNPARGAKLRALFEKIAW